MVTLCALVLAATKNYHHLGGLNNEHLFLTILEAGKSKTWGSSGPASQLANGCLLAVSSPNGEQREGTSFFSPWEHTDTNMRAPSSWPNYLPKVPSPNAILIGLRISTCELGVGTEMHSVVSSLWFPPIGIKELPYVILVGQLTRNSSNSRNAILICFLQFK